MPSRATEQILPPSRPPDRPLRNNLIIAAGATIGVLARFLIGQWSAEQLTPAFPLGTLIVNLSGCLLLGVVQTIFSELRMMRAEVQLLLAVGLLGGFTTFSTFSVETVRLLQSGRLAQALVYQVLSLLGGIVAVLIGGAATHAASHRLRRRRS
jgi:fluoride exporter